MPQVDFFANFCLKHLQHNLTHKILRYVPPSALLTSRERIPFHLANRTASLYYLDSILTDREWGKGRKGEKRRSAFGRYFKYYFTRVSTFLCVLSWATIVWPAAVAVEARPGSSYYRAARVCFCVCVFVSRITKRAFWNRATVRITIL